MHAPRITKAVGPVILLGRSVHPEVFDLLRYWAGMVIKGKAS